MTKFLRYNQLSAPQLEQYQKAITLAFPPIIVASQHIKQHWPRVEQYFPETQIYLLNDENKIIGFMNMVPIHWDRPINELPQNGWDWMLQKGIRDYENDIKANTLGGLQVIVNKEYQSKGYSKLLLAEAKKLKSEMGFSQFIIPIRPILKSKHPETSMSEYLLLKTNDQSYDPWIKTHLNCGAKISHVCSESMKVYGDLAFWKTQINAPLDKSGKYIVAGALNPVTIQVEKNYGEYLEENIWIYYQ